MALLTLTNAGYRYQGTERWIFRRFDMTIEPGEAIRVTGRNGSGKTTLLKVLSGLLKLTEGERRPQPGTKVAYMDQFAGDMLARDLTIAEQFKAATATCATSNASTVELLSQFGLGLQERRGEFVGYLSGGQRQIVALLCTLAAGASILLLDEFTSALDERSVEVAERLLAHLRAAANVSLVLVSQSVLATKIDRELDISRSARWE